MRLGRPKGLDADHRGCPEGKSPIDRPERFQARAPEVDMRSPYLAQAKSQLSEAGAAWQPCGSEG